MSFVNHGWPGVDWARVDAQLQRLRRVGRSRGRRLSAVQRDLGRIALVARALSELAIAKGLITQDELLARIERIDLEDGVADGALDPRAVVAGTPAEPKPPAAADPARRPSSKSLARARERVKRVRASKPPPPAARATRELVGRARERLKAMREEKRRRNLP